MAEYHYPVKDIGALGLSPVRAGGSSPSPTRRLLAEHEHRVRKNYVLLVEQLQWEDVMDHMINAMVLTFDDRDHVMSAEGSRKGQNRLFLDCVLRAGEQAYFAFIQALKETGQQQIAEKLEHTEPEKVQPPTYDQVMHGAVPSAPAEERPDFFPVYPRGHHTPVAVDKRHAQKPTGAGTQVNPMKANVRDKPLMRIKPKVKATLSSQGDSDKPWITNILALHNGRLVLADRSNKALKVAWMTSLYSLTLPLRPWALALLDPDTVAVTSLGDNVIFVVDVSEEPVVTREIRTARRYRGIARGACLEDEEGALVVSCPAEGPLPPAVDVISRDGRWIRTVLAGGGGPDAGGLRLPDYLHVIGDEVLVSDSSANAVFRVRLCTGRLLHVYKDENLKYPQQLTADGGGNVYVACHDSQSVLVTSGGGDGTWRTLLSGSQHGDGLKPVPYCVAATDTGVVWVGWGQFGEASVILGHQLE